MDLPEIDPETKGTRLVLFLNHPDPQRTKLLKVTKEEKSILEKIRNEFGVLADTWRDEEVNDWLQELAEKREIALRSYWRYT